MVFAAFVIVVSVIVFGKALEVLLEFFVCGLFILDLCDLVLEEVIAQPSNVSHGLTEQREVLVGVVRQGVEN